jgi:hypothetical protein
LYHLQAFLPARKRATTLDHTLKKVTTLILQRLAEFNPGTQNIPVADLKLILSEARRLGRHGHDALFKHTYLFHAVEVVEHNPFLTADDHDFSDFVWVGPAYVDVAYHIIFISERNKPYVFAAVSQDLGTHGADPLWNITEQVVEYGDVVRS